MKRAVREHLDAAAEQTDAWTSIHILNSALVMIGKYHDNLQYVICMALAPYYVHLKMYTSALKILEKAKYFVNDTENEWRTAMLEWLRVCAMVPEYMSNLEDGVRLLIHKQPTKQNADEVLRIYNQTVTVDGFKLNVKWVDTRLYALVVHENYEAAVSYMESIPKEFKLPNRSLMHSLLCVLNGTLDRRTLCENNPAEYGPLEREVITLLSEEHIRASTIRYTEQKLGNKMLVALVKRIK